MSETIDNRVVEMRFDNQQFESGVQTSLSTLDKLKQALNLSGAAKGLEEVSNSAKGMNFSGLSGAVDTVRERFSALEVMGITALANIANSAVNAGKQLVESLTIAPIKQGFDEYELKMGAVQTIMASSGADIKTVNDYLQELNTYADKTIYSFSDMTQSIGKFTNAGVSLDDAVKAIQGISNEAAVSGANTNEASRAMYNFAQALSAGSVKLIDWKSIENANMATVEFKQSLLDTALAMGTVTKQGDKYISTTTDANGKVSDAFDATANFNDSLSSQWMTTDVLIQTLGNYATDVRDMTKEEKKAYEEKLKSIGYTDEQIKSIEKLGSKAFDSAQDVKTWSQLIDTLQEAVGSGWATTFELLFGDLEEAKKLWTGVSNVVGGFIDQTSDARNAMLQEWKDLGGRTAIIDGLKNAFEGLVSVLKPIGQAFREVFPPTTGKQLYDLSVRFKEFTSHLTLGKTASENLKRTFKGLFSILDIGKTILVTVFEVLTSVFSLFSGAGGKILGFTAAIGDWISSFDQTIKSGNKVAETIQNVIDKIKSLFKSTGGNLDMPKFKILDGLLERFHKRIDSLKPSVDKSNDASEKFLKIWEKIQKVFGDVKSKVGDVLSDIADKIANANFDKIKDLVNVLSVGGLSAGLGLVIKNFNKLIKGDKGTPLGNLIEGITTTLKDFGSIGKSIAKSFNGVAKVLDEVRGCLKAYQTQLKAGALIKIAGAVGILAASILVLSFIDSDRLMYAIGAITVLFTDLMGAMAVFSRISGNIKNVIKVIPMMVGLSVAVLIMASALKKVSDLNASQMITSVGGILVLTAAMVAAAKIMGSGGKSVIKGAFQMILFASAMNVLVGATKSIADMNPKQLEKGLLGVGSLLAGMVGFLRTAKINGKTMGTVLEIITLTYAIEKIANVCAQLGKLSWEELGRGVAGVGALLAEVAGFTKFAGNKRTTIQMKNTGAAMLAIGKSMEFFASAISSMAKLKWEELAIGLSGIAGAMLSVGIMTKIMPKNLPVIGAGLLLVAKALDGVAKIVTGFSSMSWDEIGRGLAALGGSLVVLAVGLRAMNGTASGAMSLQGVSMAIKPLIPVMESLGNLSWDQVAHGLVALGGSIGILAGGLHLMNGTISGTVSLLAAALALKILAPVLSSLGNMNWESIAKGLAAIAGAFAVIGVAGLLLAPVVPAILALSGAFVLLGVGFTGIGVGLLAAGVGLAAFAAGIAALAITTSTEAAAIVAAVSAIVMGVAALIPMIATKIAEGIIAFCQTLANGAGKISISLITIINQIAADLTQTFPTVVNTIFSLLSSLLEALKRYTPTLVQTGCDIIIAFLDGIAANISQIVQAGIDVVLGFIDGVTQKLPDIIQAGFDLLIGFIDGLTKAIDENTPRLVESMKNLILTAINAAIVVLTGGAVNFKAMGQKLMDSGLIKGLKERASNFGKSVKETVSNGIKAIRSKFSEWLSNGKATAEKFVTGVRNKGKDLAKEAKKLVTDGLNAVKKKFNDWKNAGKNMIDKFVDGIRSKFGAVRQAAQNLINKAKSALDGGKDKAASAGRNFGEGFKSGISSVVDGVASAARSMVERAISAAKAAQKSASPSKVTRALGQFFGSGYMLGIRDMKTPLVSTTKKVLGRVIDISTGIVQSGRDAVAELAQTFLVDAGGMVPDVSAVRSVAGALSDALNFVPDETTPTIRPVLDLSNIKDGIGDINSLFSTPYLIPALANIDGISASMSSHRTVGNDDVVDAIKSLRKEISGISSNTTTIGGITYDDGSNVNSAVRELVRAVKMERRG